MKEGLTVFREQEYIEDQLEKEISRINQTDFLIKNQFKEDSGTLSHSARPTRYLEINNFYTATVYEKSAEMLVKANDLKLKDKPSNIEKVLKLSSDLKIPSEVPTKTKSSIVG